jgi:hypothetical protein
MAGKMAMSGTTEQNMQIDVSMMQLAVAQYEFQNCLVEHNLEDENGNTLSFPQDMGRLNPRIGEEISSLIDKLNQFEVSEGNSGNGSSSL